MRHIAETFLESTLRRGKTVEQFLGGRAVDGDPMIRWVRIVPASDNFEVWLHEDPDLGNEDFVDLVEFSGDVEVSPVAVFAMASEALEFASRMGAPRDRWVNEGVSGDEYRDYVLAGRPLRWPRVGA